MEQFITRNLFEMGQSGKAAKQLEKFNNWDMLSQSEILVNTSFE